ncbi:SufD family Fe-S cluster assembly protein [Acidianus manzaensis]|uniref:Fe-S cluster assembly protein SufD n=1 Tax=Acidianus manzaensis TaxID=282676 RepID=A0A1W6K1W7_9CREN|nr:SufD family Fe-S cluster assembly protein [Acidianus manzaensis]ARM76499.1 Fe-S cluster assembly protein SufD [Acidianus manzaensis]
MPLLDLESSKQYLNFFKDKTSREDLFLLYERLPFQVINDSPTVKHYTRWSVLDSLNLKIDRPSAKNIEEKQKEYTIIQIVNNNDIQKVMEDSFTNSLISPEEHKLVALTLALSKKLSINKGGKYFIHHYTDQDIFSPLNIEINVPENESADIIYYSESLSQKSMNSAVISISVNQNSVANLTIVTKGNNSYNFTYSKAKIKGDLKSYIISSGLAEGHLEYHSYLDEGAQAFFSSRALGIEKNNIDVLTNVYHEGKKSISNGFMKAVASGSSFVITRGNATINENAYDCSTSIIGRAIMIGKEASAAVAPMLEVKTGRVITAKHSAAVSRVPEDLIFYLQNRGFDRKTAEGMIIRGFLEDEGDTEIVKNLIGQIMSTLGY